MNQKTKQNNQVNKLNILISCYEVPALEKAVKQIIKRLEGLEFNGPIPLPRKKKVIAVLRSPHKHKRSQEHLGRIIYRRSIQILNASLADLNFAKFAYSDLKIPSNVDIKLKQS